MKNKLIILILVIIILLFSVSFLLKKEMTSNINMAKIIIACQDHGEIPIDVTYFTHEVTCIDGAVINYNNISGDNVKDLYLKFEEIDRNKNEK